MKSLVFLVLGLLCAQAMVMTATAAAFASNELALARTQGSNSLATFRKIITPANFNLMGFQTTNELTHATNAEPLLVYTMPVNRLRNYLTGQDANLLLEPDPRQSAPPQVIIPIVVGTEVRSSTTLRFRPGSGTAPGEWVTINWGQPKVIRRLMTTYGIVSPALPAGAVPFAVEIPIFDLWLIGYHDPQNRLVLRSTSDVPLGSLTILRHEIVTDAALERLAYEAQRYNGFPN
jgi:hypothetical protein